MAENITLSALEKSILEEKSAESFSGNDYLLSGIARGVDVHHKYNDGSSMIVCGLEQPNYDNYAVLTFFVPIYESSNVASALKISSETNKPVQVKGLFQGGSVNVEKPVLPFLVKELNFGNLTYSI